MAAARKLGMALASETLNVLMSAGMPVLVSSSGDPQPSAHAIGIIRDEHRSLAAVMHAWMLALPARALPGAAPDARLMRAILRYIQDFPVALHHPKEEQHLFRRLRERSESIGVELDELERQHARDIALVAELARLVDALADAGADAVAQAAELEEAVKAYAAFLWEHMGREEGAILPAAQRHLTRGRLGRDRRRVRAERRPELRWRNRQGIPPALFAHRQRSRSRSLTTPGAAAFPRASRRSGFSPELAFNPLRLPTERGTAGCAALENPPRQPVPAQRQTHRIHLQERS